MTELACGNTMVVETQTVPAAGQFMVVVGCGEAMSKHSELNGNPELQGASEVALGVEEEDQHSAEG